MDENISWRRISIERGSWNENMKKKKSKRREEENEDTNRDLRVWKVEKNGK